MSIILIIWRETWHLQSGNWTDRHCVTRKCFCCLQHCNGVIIMHVCVSFTSVEDSETFFLKKVSNCRQSDSSVLAMNRLLFLSSLIRTGFVSRWKRQKKMCVKLKNSELSLLFVISPSLIFFFFTKMAFIGCQWGSLFWLWRSIKKQWEMPSGLMAIAFVSHLYWKTKQYICRIVNVALWHY